LQRDMRAYYLAVFSSYDVQAPVGILDYKVSREVSSETSIIRPHDTIDECLACLLVVVQISATHNRALNQ